MTDYLEIKSDGALRIRDQFDESDPNNLGRPKYWNTNLYIAAIEMMLCADEIINALKMIEMVPGWHREHPDPRIEDLKQKIYERTYDIFEYANDDDEASCERSFGEAQWDNGYMYPRAGIISAEVKAYNDLGKTPWIFDLGCSHGNLPLGLIKTGHKFTYLGKSMNWRAGAKVKQWCKDVWAEKPAEGQPAILFCSEVLEHCFNSHDITHAAYKVGVTYDQIHLSVPYGTMGGGLPDWNRRLGHVRTWTISEIVEYAQQAFPGFQWTVHKSHSMVLVGRSFPSLTSP